MVATGSSDPIGDVIVALYCELETGRLNEEDYISEEQVIGLSPMAEEREIIAVLEHLKETGSLESEDVGTSTNYTLTQTGEKRMRRAAGSNPVMESQKETYRRFDEAILP